MKICELFTKVWETVEYTLKYVCLRPSPMKRFITVLITGCILLVANIYFVVSSIYNMGKGDAKKEFLELQHIEAIELQKKNDSIQSIKNYKLKIKSKEYE